MRQFSRDFRENYRMKVGMDDNFTEYHPKSSHNKKYRTVSPNIPVKIITLP